ncbi:MAG TPA: hypothetical protein VFH68_20560 [Polyangia bacterium]|jgi:hypothetical protein|nr:hypothetical protein [Polyangia bacterium]
MARPRSPLTHPVRLFAILAALSSPLAGAGCDDSTPPTTNVVVPTTGLVVLNSDYHTTSISLVDPRTRTLVRDRCVDSNTVPLKLSLVLSRDVMLASQPQVGGDIVLIDNENKALTWVDPQTCVIRDQLSVGDFNVLPHDVISVSASKAYVTRFGSNPAPTSDPMSRGEDLIIVNPRAEGGAIITGRIDMAPYAAPVAGAVIQARPDRGILVGTKVYVTLASQSADYASTGEGRIVIVDTMTDTVSGMIPLPGLAGCARLDYFAGGQMLYAACGGSSSDLDPSATAGVALIELGVDPPLVSKVIPASAFGGRPINFSWVAPLSGDLFFAASFGAKDFATNAQLAPDAMWAVFPSSGAASKQAEGGAYNLGRAALLASPATLFVPDADPAKPVLHVFSVSAADAVPADDLDANPSVHWPPREIAWY